MALFYPVIKPTVTDGNDITYALTGDRNKLVRFYSNARASATFEHASGAVLTSFSIRNNGIEKYANPSVFSEVEDGTFHFTAVDSKGNKNTETVEKDVVWYSKVTCNMDKCTIDTDGNATINCFGNYFNNSFGKVHNTLQCQYRYKKYGGTYSEWMDMTQTLRTMGYTATASLSGLTYTDTYIFQCKAVDKLKTAQSEELPVKSVPIFDWGKNDFNFNVPVHFSEGATGIDLSTIKGNCTVTGDLRLKGIGDYGNAIYFGDGEYATISEPTDDDLRIKAGSVTIDSPHTYFTGNNVYIRSYSLDWGVWFPTLTTPGAVSSYLTQEGWYQKVGRCVTIGWMIKARCYSGYNGTSLEIAGVPFTPSSNAFGGGIALGPYVAAGLNFEGWSVNTSGLITPRLQPCNNTSAGNLNISSTSYYPSGGGEVSLAGTICYITGAVS